MSRSRTASVAVIATLLTAPSLVAQPAELDSTTRVRVIDGAIRELRASYVFPETAERMASAVRERQKRGDYDAVTSAMHSPCCSPSTSARSAATSTCA
jgi:hypothetical protein